MLPYDPEISLIRDISREKSNSKGSMHHDDHSNTTYNSQDMSTDRWMDKDNVAHTHTHGVYTHIHTQWTITQSQ